MDPGFAATAAPRNDNDTVMNDTGIILPPPRVDPYRGPPPHEKGPLVFLDYDQIELDAAYDQAFYQPNILQLNKRWASNSARTRARIGEPLRRAYGKTPIEQLDIFSCGKTGAFGLSVRKMSSSSMALSP